MNTAVNVVIQILIINNINIKYYQKSALQKKTQQQQKKWKIVKLFGKLSPYKMKKNVKYTYTIHITKKIYFQNIPTKKLNIICFFLF